MRIGADPECLLVDKIGNFKAVCGLLDGHDKWNPFQVPDMEQGFTFQEDNVCIEFGVPPASTAAQFKHHIKAVQKRFLKEYKHLKFSNLSCAVFPDEEMKHPAAHIFGCEADFNAWNGKVNKKPKPPVPNMRSAGGHVHIETKLDVRKVIQACDLFLGVPSILMDNGEMRKQLYGKAGCYRSKPYGGEYRTLSNFWFLNPDKYSSWVWEGVARALDLVNTPTNWKGSSKGDVGSLKEFSTQIIRCINENDKNLAEELVETWNLEVV